MSRLQEHREHRFQALSELLGNKFSSISTFYQVLNLFFLDNCELLSDSSLKTGCATILGGSIQKVSKYLMQGYLAFLGRLESEFEIMADYLAYLQNAAISTPAWLYSVTNQCVTALPKPWTQAGLWSCFSLSDEFSAVREAKKLYMPNIASSVTTTVVDFVKAEISSTNKFNLQFLVIVLLLITITLGV